MKTPARFKLRMPERIERAKARAHALYLPGETHSAETAAVLREAAQFADSATPVLRRQGVDLVVWRVRDRDLQDPRVREAFRRRGVGGLPALLAGGRAAVGCHEIEQFYVAAGYFGGDGGPAAGAPRSGRPPARGARRSAEDEPPPRGDAADHEAAALDADDDAGGPPMEDGDEILAAYFDEEVALARGSRSRDEL
jgi:hypothetical protein